MEQGEPVNIEFSSADASTAAEVTLSTNDGSTRTLAANEVLLVDSLNAAVGTGVTATVIDDADGDGAVDAKERIAVFAEGNGNAYFGCEGRGGKVGVTPKVKGSGAGQIDITGSGRIIKGKTEGVRPSWKESEH